jgi:glycosyltransferase involved in cell wall biosynthesis
MTAKSKQHKVAVIIPCYNEATTIAKVLRGFYSGMLAKDVFDFDLIVIDNNSTDDTARIAKEAGAKVIHEKQRGKGHAIRLGFKSIKPGTEYVVMLDGDNTYRPNEVLRMLEPLVNNFCDVVIGSRLSGKISGEAMHTINRGGNWVYTHLVRLIYRVNITDALSGYFAFTKDAVDNLLPHLRSHGFAIEMEMITKLSKMKADVYSVPISYDQRGGDSSLKPFQDGIKIMRTLLGNLRWQVPKQTGGEAEADV